MPPTTAREVLRGRRLDLAAPAAVAACAWSFLSPT
jgi:hypothetical protein